MPNEVRQSGDRSWRTGRKLIENWSEGDRKLVENWSRIGRKLFENWLKIVQDLNDICPETRRNCSKIQRVGIGKSTGVRRKFIEIRWETTQCNSFSNSSNWLAGTWKRRLFSISPCTDSVFVGQWLSGMHCPPAQFKTSWKNKRNRIGDLRKGCSMFFTSRFAICRSKTLWSVTPCFEVLSHTRPPKGASTDHAFTWFHLPDSQDGAM